MPFWLLRPFCRITNFHIYYPIYSSPLKSLFDNSFPINSIYWPIFHYSLLFISCSPINYLLKITFFYFISFHFYHHILPYEYQSLERPKPHQAHRPLLQNRRTFLITQDYHKHLISLKNVKSTFIKTQPQSFLPKNHHLNPTLHSPKHTKKPISHFSHLKSSPTTLQNYPAKNFTSR